MSDYSELLNPQLVKSEGKYGSPPGYETSGAKKSGGPAIKKPDQSQLDDLKVKKAWEVAMGPAKAIPMNLIMSYMTGNSLQIIPIMMTLMLLWNPLKAIFTETNAAFKPFETKGNLSDILKAKAVFVICQIGSIAVGVWKLNNMGLIPNREADWLAWKGVVQLKESVLSY